LKKVKFNKKKINKNFFNFLVLYSFDYKQKIITNKNNKMQIDLESENNNNNNNNNNINKNTNTKEEDLISQGTEITFSYLPYEQLNKLYIMGDFTDWAPKEMTKNKDIFIYKETLLKGFKYYYCYSSSDHFYVDFNNEYEMNIKNNQSNNFLIIKNENSINIDIQNFIYREKS
jgi:hypothetical protein